MIHFFAIALWVAGSQFWPACLDLGIAIFDSANRIVREHASRNFAMLHSHAVDVMGAAQSQVRHVEDISAETAGSFQGSCAIGPENLQNHVF
jgi:hypothetical protein